MKRLRKSISFILTVTRCLFFKKQETRPLRCKKQDFFSLRKEKSRLSLAAGFFISIFSFLVQRSGLCPLFFFLGVPPAPQATPLSGCSLQVLAAGQCAIWLHRENSLPDCFFALGPTARLWAFRCHPSRNRRCF